MVKSIDFQEEIIDYAKYLAVKHDLGDDVKVHVDYIK